MAGDARICGPRAYPLRVVWLYGRLLRQHVLARLSYETDILLSIGASALTQALGLVFLRVVFDRIPSVRGWTFWDAVLLYGLLLVVRGLAAAFGDGAWSIGGAIQRGGLDRLLLRPLPVLLQLYGSSFGWSAVADIGLGAAVLATAVAHAPVVVSARTVLALAIALPSGAAVYGSAMLAANAIGFWTIGARGPVAFLLHGVSELAKFPLTVYPRLLADVLTWCLPFAFLSFYPARTLMGDSGLAVWLSPVVGGGSLLCAGLIWRAGLRRYEGTGS